jgi:hypothetical protein
MPKKMKLENMARTKYGNEYNSKPKQSKNNSSELTNRRY